MDFSIPDDIVSLVATVRELVETRVEPLEAAFLARGFGHVEPALKELRAHVQTLGLLAPHVSRAHGGAGLSLVAFAHVSEALGRSPLAHFAFNCQAPDAGNMELLAHHGTPDQQARFLRPLVN